MPSKKIRGSICGALLLLTAGPAFAQAPGKKTAPAPDLVPIPSRILVGTVSVQNKIGRAHV
mgnify:FL=1